MMTLTVLRGSALLLCLCKAVVGKGEVSWWGGSGPSFLPLRSPGAVYGVSSCGLWGVLMVTGGVTWYSMATMDLMGEVWGATR